MRCLGRKSCSTRPIPVPRIDGEDACSTWTYAMTLPTTPIRDMSYFVHTCRRHPLVTWPCWTTYSEPKWLWTPPASPWGSTPPPTRLLLPTKQRLQNLVQMAPQPLLLSPPPQLRGPSNARPPHLTYTHPPFPIHPRCPKWRVWQRLQHLVVLSVLSYWLTNRTAEGISCDYKVNTLYARLPSY